MGALPNTLLLTLNEFAAAARVHPQTILRGVRAGTWPQPIPRPRKPMRWPRETVVEFLKLSPSATAAT